MIIRPLRPDEAHLYIPLRQEALAREPHSFAASPEDDRAMSAEQLATALAGKDQAIFGAFDPSLIGSVGIYRDALRKGAHKAHIWGMYVGPLHRNQGIGRKLMTAAIAWASQQDGVLQIHLVVSSRTPAAEKLYESLGFRTWGVEPAALRIQGELVDDHHMVLVL